MERYIIWSSAEKLEGIIIDDKAEAQRTARKQWLNGGSSLCAEFIEAYEWNDDPFVLETIKVKP